MEKLDITDVLMESDRICCSHREDFDCFTIYRKSGKLKLLLSRVLRIPFYAVEPDLNSVSIIL